MSQIQSSTDWSAKRQQLRDEARDALLFAQTKMSIYYDLKYKPLSQARRLCISVTFVSPLCSYLATNAQMKHPVFGGGYAYPQENI
jgi:hypothetical protein